MNDKPKPTESEWTVETVDYLLDYRRLNSKAVVEAHNAALAAEREKTKSWYEHTVRCEEELVAALKEAVVINALVSEQTKQLATLSEQLAAERDKASIGRMYEERSDQIAPRFTAQQWNILRNTVEGLRQQLAAEREAHKLNLDAVAQYVEQNQQLREQLAAEREKAGKEP